LFVKIRKQTFLLSALLLFAAAHTAFACTTPVYQWAMHRWEPDPWQAALFQQTQPEASAFEAPAPNLRIESVKPEDAEGAMKALWEKQAGAETPWFVVRFPRIPPPHGQVHGGPFSEARLAEIIDSPVRRKLGRRLIAGDAAVFLFLESGDAEKDRTAREQLDASLKTMEKEVRKAREAYLAELSRYELQAESPDAVRFSVLPLSRDDAAEWFLVEMLLRSESDLMEYGEPMAFPVFGRGRLLYALVGKGINEDTIESACMYIGSACTCTVKVDNPGFDLLMRADWPRAATEFETPLDGEVREARQPEVAEEELPDFQVRGLVFALGGALGGVFLLVLGVSVFLVWRKKKQAA
jgi:hypothetical protein